MFNSDLFGLNVYDVEYVSGQDGVLIYNKTRDVRANEVEVQACTNTSTLIPAFHPGDFVQHLL